MMSNIRTQGHSVTELCHRCSSLCALPGKRGKCLLLSETFPVSNFPPKATGQVLKPLLVGRNLYPDPQSSCHHAWGEGGPRGNSKKIVSCLKPVIESFTSEVALLILLWPLAETAASFLDETSTPEGAWPLPCLGLLTAAK